MNIIQFPAVKEGKDEEFRKWFEWSNDVYAKFDGFISRRLLKSKEKDTYVGLVEHETEETFIAMHLSPDRQKAWEKVEPLLEASPIPTFYTVGINIEEMTKATDSSIEIKSHANPFSPLKSVFSLHKN